MAINNIGRPTDEVKNIVIRARVSKSTVDLLDECTTILNSNRSEIIRAGIEKVYDDLKTNK